MDDKTVTAILLNSSKCELDRVTGRKASKSLWQVNQRVSSWLETITDGDTIHFEVNEPDILEEEIEKIVEDWKKVYPDPKT